MQIDAIEHLKRSTARSSGVYARIARKFLDDESWKAADWSYEQFMELIQPLISVQKTIIDMRDQTKSLLETISRKWSQEIADVLRSENFGQTCYRTIAAVSGKYENRYQDARNALNHTIIQRILSQKSRQSSRRYANLMDWTAILNRSLQHQSLPPITSAGPGSIDF